MIDRYKHLNDDRASGTGATIGIEEIAKQIVPLNYGVHRLLSAVVRSRREDNRLRYQREAKKEGKGYLLEDELADAIEALLNRGLF